MSILLAAAILAQPSPPATQGCPDGRVILATDACPIPPLTTAPTAAPPVNARPRPPILYAPPPPPPGTPSPFRSRARAQNALAAYLTQDDYPAEAERLGQEGTVGFRLDIAAEGRVTGCTILSSSGSALLDATTCRLMQMRPRFTPALDQSGRPVADTAIARVRWQLPPYVLPDVMRAAWVVDGGGGVRECRQTMVRNGVTSSPPPAACAPPQRGLFDRLIRYVGLSGSTLGFRIEQHFLKSGADNAYPLTVAGERVVSLIEAEADIGPDGRITACRRGEMTSEIGPAPDPCIALQRLPTRALRGRTSLRSRQLVIVTEASAPPVAR